MTAAFASFALLLAAHVRVPPPPLANEAVVLFNSSMVPGSIGVGGPIIVQTPRALLAFGTANFKQPYHDQPPAWRNGCKLVA